MRPRTGVAAMALFVLAAGARAGDCSAQPSGLQGIRAVVVLEGESDPDVARGVRSLGANTMATLTPPRAATAAAVEAEGLAYIPRLSVREVDRLPGDPAEAARIRSLPALSGIHYLDEDVLEGFATPETQARAYGILKSLFPDLTIFQASRLDPIATTPGYLDSYFRPEYGDLVAPYFYPVGTTVLGTQEQGDPWPERLRALLGPLAARVPAGKAVLPVLQAFEQEGYPVSGGVLSRQLDVYREMWPGVDSAAVFWWGGEASEPFAGIVDRPSLRRGTRMLFGALPSRPSPCPASPRSR